MKIGEVARRLGTTVRTLRFYEEQGLISPQRSSGGTRRYSEADLLRFASILSLAAIGTPLADIRRLAESGPDGGHADEVSRRIDTHLAGLADGLAEQRRRIERVEQDIAGARERLAHCFECEVTPSQQNCAGCDVSSGLVQSEVMRLIWE